MLLLDHGLGLVSEIHGPVELLGDLAIASVHRLAMVDSRPTLKDQLRTGHIFAKSTGQVL